MGKRAYVHPHEVDLVEKADGKVPNIERLEVARAEHGHGVSNATFWVARYVSD